MPCTHSSSSSSWVVWPAFSACSAATGGHSTTSPRSPGSGPWSSRLPPRCGGRSSSMGKASTSVGPGSPIHRSCSSVIVRSSTSSTDSSASGWIRIWSRVNRATAASPTSSTSTPASLAISMLIGGLAALPPGRPGTPVKLLSLAFLRVVALVRVDDLADQAVPYDVVAGEPSEVDVLDAVEDALHHAQAADLPGGQVDLGHVAGHHHLRAEAQPGEEHLHLLGRRVLRLVQDDERVVQGVVGEQEVLGGVKGVGRGYRDAHRLAGAGRLDALDEAHRAPAAARRLVRRQLPPEAERLDACREPDVDDVRVVAVIDGTPLDEVRGAAVGGTGATVGDAAQRPDQEDHVVAQPRRGGRVLDAAGPVFLNHWAAVSVEQALQNGQPNLDRVV